MFFFSYNNIGLFGGIVHEIFSIIILVLASTIDTLLAGFIYGIGKIKIPISSGLIIGLVSSILFTVTVAFGNIIGYYLSGATIKWFCFILLFMMGFIEFCDGIIKDFIRSHGLKKKQLHFHISNFTFVFTVFANPEKADQDESKILSVVEAMSAALALSLDGIGIGVIAGMSKLNLISCFITSSILTILMLLIGLWIGKHCQKYLKHDITWLSGILLILFAIMKVLS